jgi:hypothetical protein
LVILLIFVGKRYDLTEVQKVEWTGGDNQGQIMDHGFTPAMTNRHMSTPPIYPELVDRSKKDDRNARILILLFIFCPAHLPTNENWPRLFEINSGCLYRFS